MSKNKRRKLSELAKPRPSSNSLSRAGVAPHRAKPFQVKSPAVKPARVETHKVETNKVETHEVETKRKTRQRRTSDLRVRRTRSRLSNALVALSQQKPIDQVTVQEVLDRAGVGRSTFYLHYRDKNDLFLDLMENGMEMWSNALSKVNEKSRRLVPVEEFFAHAASAMTFYRALIDSGRIHAFFDLAQGCFARGIARRMKEIGSPNPSAAKIAGRELDARSHALAGNLLSLLKWWLDHGAKESPRAMDELFHGIVWKGVQ